MKKGRTDACILTGHLCGVAGRTDFPNPEATLFDCSAGDSTQSILPHPSPRYIYQRMRSGRSNETTDRRAAGRMRRNVECISTQCIQFLVEARGGSEGGSQPRGKQRLWWPATTSTARMYGAFTQARASERAAHAVQSSAVHSGPFSSLTTFGLRRRRRRRRPYYLTRNHSSAYQHAFIMYRVKESSANHKKSLVRYARVEIIPRKVSNEA